MRFSTVIVAGLLLTGATTSFGQAVTSPNARPTSALPKTQHERWAKVKVKDVRPSELLERLKLRDKADLLARIAVIAYDVDSSFLVRSTAADLCKFQELVGPWYVVQNPTSDNLKSNVTGGFVRKR